MAEIQTNVAGFYKSDQGFLVNKDKEALLAYKKKKEQAEKLHKVEEDIEDLRVDIKEIKQLVLKLLDK